jgi:hypothetical protein
VPSSIIFFEFAAILRHRHSELWLLRRRISGFGALGRGRQRQKRGNRDRQQASRPTAPFEMYDGTQHGFRGPALISGRYDLDNRFYDVTRAALFAALAEWNGATAGTVAIAIC